MPATVTLLLDGSFLIQADERRSIVSADEIAQALVTTDEAMRGVVESSGMPVLGVPGRYSFDSAARAAAEDAIIWLSMRGLISFVNGDPNTVDLPQ